MPQVRPTVALLLLSLALPSWHGAAEVSIFRGFGVFRRCCTRQCECTGPFCCSFGLSTRAVRSTLCCFIPPASRAPSAVVLLPRARREPAREAQQHCAVVGPTLTECAPARPTCPGASRLWLGRPEGRHHGNKGKCSSPTVVSSRFCFFMFGFSVPP